MAVEDTTGDVGSLAPTRTTVDTDTPRRHCGYNLRGLNVQGRCPEYATPVGLAIHGDMLRYADPAWVGRLARGAQYMFAGLIVNVAVGLLSSCVAWFAPGGIPASRLGDLLGGLLGLYGAWLLTSRDPSGVGEDPYLIARRVVRAGLIAGLTQQRLIIFLPPQASPSRSIPAAALPEYVLLLTVAFLIPAGIAMLVFWFMTFALPSEPAEQCREQARISKETWAAAPAWIPDSAPAATEDTQ